MRLLPLILFLISITIILYFISSERKGANVRELVRGSVMKDVDIIHFKETRKDWTARVREAFFRSDNELVDLKGVRLDYPERELQLRARVGVYDLGSGRIKLKKDIRGTVRDTEFSSASLTYNPDNNMILAKKGIIIKGKRFRVTGDSGKIVDGMMRIQGNVNAVFY